MPTSSDQADTLLRQARRVAMVVAAAQFMAGLDSTVLVTAIPRMARDFAVPATALASTITIYILVSTALMPMSSWIGQRFGARRVFMIAIIGFTLASIGCGLSHGLGTFLVMRAAQAAFGSLMAPVGALVQLKITPKRYLVSVMAISSTPALIAPVVGPPLGGFITSFLEWPWVFFINVPIGLLGWAAARRFMPRLAQEPAPFDFRGFALASGTSCAVIFALDRLGSHGAQWRFGLGLLVAGLVLGGFAVRHARRAPHPIVPLSPLRFPCFNAATVSAGTFVRLAFAAQGFTMPLMLQLGLGLSPFQAGLLLLAQNAGDLALKPVAGRILTRLGFRTALVGGSLAMAVSLALCALLTPALPFAWIAAFLFCVGMARSVLFTSLMALRYADMPQHELAGAQVLGNLANQVQQAVAISCAALLLNLLSGHAHVPSLTDFHIAMLVLAGSAALGAPAFARLHPDAGAEVSGQARAGRVEEIDAMGQAE